MKKILITGISGTGKSAVTCELAALGYKAVDADTEAWSEWAPVVDPDIPGTPVRLGEDWVWREDRIRELLATEDADTLFVSGCAANMGQFLPQFDRVVLLSAPEPLIAERLATRTTNDYGKHPDEVARVLDLKQTVEPLLRKVAGHEIDTTAPLDQVVNSILRLVP